MTEDEFWGRADPPEEMVAVMGCVRIEGNPIPQLPSSKDQCEACKAAVWVSDETLRVMPDVRKLCMDCVMELMTKNPNAPAKGEVAPHTREQLRAAGLNDEQIDRATELYNASIDIAREIVTEEMHEHGECDCDWHGETTCPHCGKTHDAASNFTQQGGPRPGDASICLSCGGVAVFNPDLTLRMPTPEEQRELDNDPEVAAIQTAMMMADAESD